MIFAEEDVSQVALLSKKYEQEKNELARHDTTKRLDACESKLKTYAQTVHGLDEFIISRKRESDYGALKQEVVNLTADINKMHIAAVLKPAP